MAVHLGIRATVGMQDPRYAQRFFQRGQPMTRTDYQNITDTAEQLIVEKAAPGHHDEAYGAYVLWMRLTGRFQTLKDSKRLFQLSQKAKVSEQSDSAPPPQQAGPIG